MTGLHFTSTLKPQSAIGKYVSSFSDLLIAPSFDQQSQYAVDFLTWLRQTNALAKKNLGKYTKAALTLMALPVVWVIFWALFKQLKRRYSADIQVTADNYKSLRREYDKLSKLGLDIKIPDSKNLSFKKMPFLLRAIMRLVFDIACLINARKDVLKKALDDINANAPSNDVLRPISENELWQRRTKAYEYRF